MVAVAAAGHAAAKGSDPYDQHRMVREYYNTFNMYSIQRRSLDISAFSLLATPMFRVEKREGTSTFIPLPPLPQDPLDRPLIRNFHGVFFNPL